MVIEKTCIAPVETSQNGRNCRSSFVITGHQNTTKTYLAKQTANAVTNNTMNQPDLEAKMQKQ